MGMGEEKLSSLATFLWTRNSGTFIRFPLQVEVLIKYEHEVHSIEFNMKLNDQNEQKEIVFLLSQFQSSFVTIF